MFHRIVHDCKGSSAQLGTRLSGTLFSAIDVILELQDQSYVGQSNASSPHLHGCVGTDYDVDRVHYLSTLACGEYGR